MILAEGMTAGGTERQIVELLKGLREIDDIRTAFGVLRKGGERQAEAEEYADVVVPIRQSSKFAFSLAFSLLRLVRKYQVDLLHTFGSICDFSGIVAGNILRKPVINGSIRSARPKLNKRDLMSRACMPLADWIVANSHAGIRAFGVEKYSKASVIHNGIDLHRFDNLESMSFGPAALCMVGNFSRKKDQAALIRALPLILKECVEARLLLVGRGEGVRDCRALARELGVERAVTFFTDTNNPEPIINGSRVCLLLSPMGEGISNVILEYMALGKPVIASNLGGNPELVEYGVNGFLLADHQPATIAEAVLSLLNNQQLAGDMGREGRRKVELEFTLERMIGQYVELYSALLRPRE